MRDPAKVCAALTVSLLAATTAACGRSVATVPHATAKPDLVVLLRGENRFWRSDGRDDLHGTVKDRAVLERNDRLVVWINRHATARQRLRALQDSEFNDHGNTYDESITEAGALGSRLGPIYVHGRLSGALPLTDSLINSENGTSGDFVSASAAKAAYGYPRPYLPVSSQAAPVAGDDPACAPSNENGSSLHGIRAGRPWADAAGDLTTRRVPDVTDTTHEFSPHDVPLSAGYGTAGICTGGSFPSGHTTSAYEAGLTLATLLPRLAPEILARASEQANDRIVLGVHYPLDIMGGRIAGEAAIAARWSEPQYVSQVLAPARRELLTYLRGKCGGSIGRCIDHERPYRDNPYGGARMPGGTAQIVTNRASALKVFAQRLTYGFHRTGAAGRAPSVPAGAENLLLSTFPTLTDAQRTAVLAQTEIPSGFPLDGTGTGGSWQRLNLAAAMSARVLVRRNSTVRVVSVGGLPTVVDGRGHATEHRARHHHHH
jgi:membrane-associated phospholipid phosphatase